jgi:Protein kinase domain
VAVQRDPGLRPNALGGRYELLELIGSGGMAAVWRARDIRLQRDVAVKVLSARLSSDVTFQRRFEREARHIASLSDSHVVAVHDFGADDGQAYIVMELVDGPSLRSRIDTVGRLSVAETIGCALDVLSGLQHAHAAGIVHRDVKPGNILLSSSGRAKVADFGIAMSSGDTTELAARGLFVGTIVYSSPEQLLGGEVGPRSDLYSLGCVLYECLTGTPPFDVEDTSRAVLQHRFADPRPMADHNAEVPSRVAEAIGRALAKDPADRFPTAEAMRAELVGAVPRPPAVAAAAPTVTATQPTRPVGTGEETAIAARPPAARPGTAGARRRRRRNWWAAAVLVVVAALTTAFIVWPGPSRRPSPPPAAGVGVGSSMVAGDTLQPGQYLRSSNGRFDLAMQRSGDLVETERRSETPLWASGSGGHPGAYAIVQGDGNLIVYPKGRSAPQSGQPTSALWQSETNGHPGASVHLLDSGNLVIRPHGATTVLWQTGTVPGDIGSQLLAGDELHPAQYLQSPNGAYRLSDDGRAGVLRLYAVGKSGCALFQMPRSGVASSLAVMQTDGNLVLYTPGSSRIAWQSGTSGHPGANVVLENDGTLVLATPTGVLLWQAGGASSVARCRLS